MATHSSVLAWRIPGTGEPGGLPPTGSHRVGHDRRDLAAAATVSPTYGEFFLIGVQLIYRVVLVSGVQQSDSVMHVYSFLCHFPLWFIIGY